MPVPFWLLGDVHGGFNPNQLPPDASMPVKQDDGGFSQQKLVSEPPVETKKLVKNIEPPEHPTVGGSSDLDTGLMKDAFTAQAFENAITPPAPPVEPKPVADEMTDYGRAGGKKRFEEAFDPNEYISAIKQGAEATQQEGEQLTAALAKQREQAGNDMAEIKARRASDDAEIKRREAELTQKTQYFTQDLADRNQFWRSPWNILAAIGAAIGGMGSRDPHSGARLIDAAIEGDFKQRQAIADQTLGALRSNIAGYRAIVGDKNAADEMALAESYRMGAMQLKEIGAKFQGKKAQATAAQLAAELNAKYSMLYMDAHSKLTMSPQFQDKRILEAEKRAGWVPIVGGQEQPIHAPQASLALSNPATQNAAAAALGSKPTSIPATGGPFPGQVYGPPAPTSEQKQSNANKANKEILEEAMKGSGAIADMYRVQNDKIQKEQGRKKMLEEIAKDKEGASKISAAMQSKDVQPRVDTYSRLDQTMRVIEAECKKYGIDPNDFLRDIKLGATGYGATINSIRLRTTLSGEQASTRDKELKEWLIASERFQQMIAGGIVDYYHSKAGSAQSAQEVQKLQDVIATDSDWHKMRGFVDLSSRAAASDYRQAMAAGGNPRSAIYYRLSTGTSSGVNVKGIK